jgi:hypothetical protein
MPRVDYSTPKPKRSEWDQLPRQGKIAAVLWPDLVPKSLQQEMQIISKGEGKLSPLEGKAARDKAYQQLAKRSK